MKRDFLFLDSPQFCHPDEGRISARNSTKYSDHQPSTINQQPTTNNQQPSTIPYTNPNISHNYSQFCSLRLLVILQKYL